MMSIPEKTGPTDGDKYPFDPYDGLGAFVGFLCYYVAGMFGINNFIGTVGIGLISGLITTLIVVLIKKRNVRNKER